MTNKLEQLAEHGQSLWYDNIARDLLESGAIQALVDEGVRGLTSNPAIFTSAITSGNAYDRQITELANAGKSPTEIYEGLAVTDIQHAADILRAVYDKTDGLDGYVSLEVSPFLANDTEGTIAEAKRLFEWVDRPNLMIKVPATDAGIPAVETLIEAGLNINVTLIFSLEMYGKVMDAYIGGLSKRDKAGLPVSVIASVASFFVSRVDSLVDKWIDEKVAEGNASIESAKGKTAIANAKLAYELFREKFSSESWKALESKGAQKQRPLWASTSTKNPDYRDVLYVETLIGPLTVNTAPPNTIDAFKDHGVVADTLESDSPAQHQLMADLASAGIDIDKATDQLLAEGVAKFAEPFEKLLSAIEEKSKQLTTA